MHNTIPKILHIKIIVLSCSVLNQMTGWHPTSQQSQMLLPFHELSVDRNSVIASSWKKDPKIFPPLRCEWQASVLLLIKPQQALKNAFHVRAISTSWEAELSGVGQTTDVSAREDMIQRCCMNKPQWISMQYECNLINVIIYELNNV